ncbi:MAG: hypothetical protein ACJ74L_08500 [Gaiellaceae bacterium]
MRLAGTCVLVLGVFVFAGSATAGNGNGNGNGNSGDGAPGNSASAPGQVKKEAPAAAPAAEQGVASAPAAPAAPPTEGMKPSNDTAHETHAAASSNETKEYGNGQNAGAIAVKHDAPPSTALHGPGNSQPHKAAPCSGGHEVDVHALKGSRAGGCGAPAPGPTPTPAPHPQPGPGPAPTPKPAPRAPADPGGSHESAPPKEEPATSSPTAVPSDPGGPGAHVAGTRTVVRVHRGTSPEVGVATAQVDHAGSLPFTGAPLWPAVLAGLGLILAGVALRKIRTAEASVESGHDHTNRTRNAARGPRDSLGGRASR